VVPNFFVTADWSAFCHFTSAWKYTIMVVIFQQLKYLAILQPGTNLSVAHELGNRDHWCK